MEIVQLSKTKFLAGCAALSAAILLFCPPLASAWIAAEILMTVIALFVLGSIKYQLDKNALTYGAAMIISATFATSWWDTSALRADLVAGNTIALKHFLQHHFLSLHGLDRLFHADTMLFILGLTFFVAVIAQTRILENLSFKVLRINRGLLLPTVAVLSAVVALASGVLDGVSMIGLLIRTLVILLLLAKVDNKSVIFSVMISTVITTVCGMYLAYGEPPNLIMKTNLHPHLDNTFFIQYCLPLALGSYLIVFWNLRKLIKGKKIDLDKLDILDQYIADVRFLQTTRHGEFYSTPLEFVVNLDKLLGKHFEPILKELHQGTPFGLAMVRSGLSEKVRIRLLEEFVDPSLARDCDYYYGHINNNDLDKARQSEKRIRAGFKNIASERLRSQKIGALSFVAFIGLLIAHAIDHKIPLFVASFTGFFVAFTGIASNKRVRAVALREAKHEFKEYLFLLPLFLSIALLQKTGFFDTIAHWIKIGTDKMGPAHLAYIQMTGATALSAILDNNIVADFASRALHNLDLLVLHLFAMAQIAGYAVGGCWTHIGSAQSVVAYSFIKKDIDNKFTPFDWIKIITPILLEIFIFMTVAVYITSWIHH